MSSVRHDTVLQQFTVGTGWHIYFLSAAWDQCFSHIGRQAVVIVQTDAHVAFASDEEQYGGSNPKEDRSPTAAYDGAEHSSCSENSNGASERGWVRAATLIPWKNEKRNGCDES